MPERVVHARGSGAHGVFTSYGDFSNITAASFLNGKGKETPVFVRFSSVAGSKGSFDAARDVHGFATRFYTDEGNLGKPLLELDLYALVLTQQTLSEITFRFSSFRMPSSSPTSSTPSSPISNPEFPRPPLLMTRLGITSASSRAVFTPCSGPWPVTAFPVPSDMSMGSVSTHTVL